MMEPDRPIDKVLREYAKKRREEAGAPFELHPATRRLLQGEIERELATGQKQVETTPTPIRLWPGLAWALGIVVVLGVAVALLVPEINRSRPSSAMTGRSTAGETVPGQLAYVRSQPSPAPAPAREDESMRLATADKPDSDLAARAGPPRLAKKAQSPAVLSTATERQLALQQNEPTGAISHSTVPANSEPTLSRRQELAAGAAPAATPPVRPAAPAPEAGIPLAQVQVGAKLSENGTRERLKEESLRTAGIPVASAPPGGVITLATPAQNGAAMLAQTQFFRLIAEAGPGQTEFFDNKPDKSSAVLRSFRMEQSGRVMRVIDSDGSLYTGYIQPPQNALRDATTSVLDAGKAKDAERETAPTHKMATIAPALSFVVTGTNQTLKLPVVFSGSIAGSPSLPSSLLQDRVSATNAVAFGVIGGTSATPATNPPVTSRVSGEARIGSDKVIPIEAVTAVESLKR